MPRGVRNNGLSIAELESLLARNKSRLNELYKQRKAVDAEIAKLEGAGGGRGRGSVGGGGRARNAKSLVETLQDVLKGAGKAMPVGDIVQGALDSGYKSSSPNFRGIVNQTLIKERKLFANKGRGVYELK
jgi:hypothetical protein